MKRHLGSMSPKGPFLVNEGHNPDTRGWHTRFRFPIVSITPHNPPTASIIGSSRCRLLARPQASWDAALR